MEILLLSEPSYPRHPGGAGKCSHLLAAGLAARGHTVRIVCESRESTEREVIDGVEVHRLRWAAAEALPRAEREAAIGAAVLEYLEREIPLERLDIVHDSGGFLSFFYPVVYRLRQRYTFGNILHFRYLMLRHQRAAAGGRPYNPYALAALSLETMIPEGSQCFPVRFADAVICPSRDDAAFAGRFYRPAPGRLAVIPDPVEPRLYQAGGGRELRQRLAGPDERLLLFGGRIDSELKGGDIVMQAFGKLLAERPGLRLALLFKEPKLLEPYRRQFGEAIRPVAWIRDAAELAELYAAVDLVLMPSRYESFGLMAAEALAAGTPVIASPVGGLRDVVEHGRNGFLFQSPRPADWTAELVRYVGEYLDDPALAEALGAAASASVSRLAVEAVAAQVELLYEEVVARATTGPLARPHLGADDEARYLALLERWLGRAARPAGQSVLDQWPATAAARCCGCTRRRLAQDSARLLLLRRAGWHRLWGWLTGRRTDGVRQAVEAACPLGLLQKEFLTEGLNGRPQQP